MNTDKVAVSVVLESELIERLDAAARAQDMNRSQYIRRIARQALEQAASAVPSEPVREEVVA